MNWADVDPAIHPSDPSTVLEVVRAVAPADFPGPYDPTARDPHEAWVDVVTHGLVEHYGDWAYLWAGSTVTCAVEGGSTDRWCCAHDSITTQERTLATVAAALIDWRSYLEALADRFARYLPLPEDPREAFAVWETAVSDLVATAMTRTGSESNWYGNSWGVLAWFLSAAGVSEYLCAALVEEAIGGRFRSWTVPTGAEVSGVAQVLAAAVTGIEPEHDTWPDTWPWGWPNQRRSELPPAARAPLPLDAAPRLDALTSWRRVRQVARWVDVSEHMSGPARAGRDGIAEVFAGREEGAARLMAALYFVLARDGVVLDQAASLLAVSRPAGETRGAEAMARHVAALAEQTRRRAQLIG